MIFIFVLFLSVLILNLSLSASGLVTPKAFRPSIGRKMPSGLRMLELNEVGEDESALALGSVLEKPGVNYIPIFAPFIAFLGYDNFVSLYHDLVRFGKSWYAVDGGQTETELITPVINGIVLPSVSIILGTLIATTITSLRNRQIAVRECLNREACDIQSMILNLDVIFDSDKASKAQAMGLVRDYVQRLIRECGTTTTSSGYAAMQALQAADSELEPLTRLLVSMPEPEDNGAKSAPIYDPFRFFLPSMINTLNAQRSHRLAVLQTGFPIQHWTIISLLYMSILLCFLEESDGAAVQFLDSLQLRLLFTILIGGCSAIISLCADLRDPFRGYFSIVQSVEQLFTVLKRADESAKYAAREATEICEVDGSIRA